MFEQAQSQTFAPYQLVSVHANFIKERVHDKKA